MPITCAWSKAVLNRLNEKSHPCSWEELGAEWGAI